MGTTVTGSCLCGKVRFSYSGPLGPANYCHCDDCRKANGSAFNIGVRVDKSALEFEDSSCMKNYEYRADSGNKMTRVFCGNCGSPIMTLHSSNEAYAWVKAGIIDQPEHIRPVHESWTSRKVAWADIHVGTSYPKNRTA